METQCKTTFANEKDFNTGELRDERKVLMGVKGSKGQRFKSSRVQRSKYSRAMVGDDDGWADGIRQKGRNIYA